MTMRRTTSWRVARRTEKRVKAQQLLVMALLIGLFSGALFAGLVGLVSFAEIVGAEPTGSQILSNATGSPTAQGAASSTTAGGSFTTLILNTTTQTPRWKAYVGNVSGRFTLDDADNYTIYDWSATSFTGEVYASRNSSPDWDSIQCAQNGTITDEHAEMNMTATNVDNINRTFNDTIHAEFYVGTKHFAPSSCRAIATFTNDTRQAPAVDADFQVVLLDDSVNLIYAALLEEDAEGYNNGQYDFQMIVAESAVQTTPHTYYFFTEFG